MLCWPPMGASVWSCAVIRHISPMALYRLVCAFGHQSLVTVLTRCGPAPARLLLWPMRSTADVSRTRCTCPRLSVAVCSGISATPRRPVQQRLPNPTVRSNAPRCSRSPRIASRESSPMASTAPPRVYGRFSGARLGTCLRHALKTAEETRGHRLPGPQDLTLAVPYPALSGTPAQGLAGVCPGPAVTPLCRSRRYHRRGNQWRARPALVPGEEGRLVYGACRPPDARHEHAAGSGP